MRFLVFTLALFAAIPVLAQKLRQLTRDPSDELATDASEKYGILLQSNRLTWQDQARTYINQIFLIDFSTEAVYRQLTFNNTTSSLAAFYRNPKSPPVGNTSEGARSDIDKNETGSKPKTEKPELDSVDASKASSGFLVPTRRQTF